MVLRSLYLPARARLYRIGGWAMRKRGDVVLWGDVVCLVVRSSGDEGQFCQVICWNAQIRYWSNRFNVYPREVVKIGSLCLD